MAVIHRVLEIVVDDDAAEDEDLINEIVTESLQNQGPVRSVRMENAWVMVRRWFLDVMHDDAFYYLENEEDSVPFEGLRERDQTKVEFFDHLIDQAEEGTANYIRQLALDMEHVQRGYMDDLDKVNIVNRWLSEWDEMYGDEE